MSSFGPSLHPASDKEVSFGNLNSNLAAGSTGSSLVPESTIDAFGSNFNSLSSVFDNNLLINGDFETDFDLAGLQSNFDVEGWHSFADLSGNRILDVVGNSDNKFLKLDLAEGRHDRIYQDVTTRSGQSYLLTFDLLGANGAAARDNDVRVYWDNEFVGNFRALDNWQTVSVELNGARNGFSRLEFREPNVDGNGGDGEGPFLDNIQLLPVKKVEFNNGSFELGDRSEGRVLYGADEVPDWSFDGQMRLRRHGNDFGNGEYYWTLDSLSDQYDQVSQALEAKESEDYFVVFDMRSSLNNSEPGNQLRIRWDGRWQDTHFASSIWQSHAVHLKGTPAGLSNFELREAPVDGNFLGDGLGPWLDDFRYYQLDTGYFDDSVAVLQEEGAIVQEERINVRLLDGEERASQIEFDIYPRFDTSDEDAAIEDVFNVYVTSPNFPDRILLDNGTPGGAIFSLSGDRAEYPAGRVRFDGKTVSIDASALPAHATNVDLLVQIIDVDNDQESRIVVGPIDRDFGGGGSTAVLRDPNVDSPGPSIDIGSLNPNSGIEANLENVRFDSSTNRLIAELNLNGLAGNSGRDVAVVFPNLPAGVQLSNASGTNEDGNPYLNLSKLIPNGGLNPGESTGFIELEFESPSTEKFRLEPRVFTGAPNRSPNFSPVAPVTILPGGHEEITLQATDEDGDELSYSLVSDMDLPNLVFEGNTIQLKPLVEDIGSYSFEVAVSDGSNTVYQTVDVVVDADPVSTTRISGRILDTELTPLENVPIELGSVTTVTDASGNFVIEFSGSAPSNALFIRGEAIPGNYPFIAEGLPLLFGRDLIPNVNNVIDRPIYLPALDIAQADFVDPTVETVIDAALKPGESPAKVFIAPGSLEDQDGSLYDGLVSITEVPRDLTPAALPAGLIPDVVVTIQPGEMEFTTPARITLPNRVGYAPGTLLDLWSIDPAIGDFAIVGTMQVSEDGTVSETISGGIRNSSWHTPVPQSGTPVDQTKDPSCSCGSTIQASSEFELFSGARTENHDLASYQSQGTTRGVSLVYDSLRANPVHLTRFTFEEVPDWVQGNTAFGLDGRMIAELAYQSRGATIQVPGNRPGEPQHQWDLPRDVGSGNGLFGAIMVDATEVETGLIPYAVRAGFGLAIEDGIIGGGVTDTVNDAFTNVNSRGSVFGNGWGIAGLQQIYEATNISSGRFADAVLLVDGNGEELVFTKPQDPPPGVVSTAYESPEGDFSLLTKTDEGTFRRTLPDQTVFVFDSLNRLSKVIDRNGNETNYVYLDGQIQQIIDPVGLATSFTYEEGRVTIESPDGRQNTLLLNENGDLVEVFNADGSSRQYGYDSEHLMVAEVDERRNQTTLYYDLLGRLRSAEHPDRTIARYLSTESQLAELASVDGDTDDLPVAPSLPDLNAALSISELGNVEQYVLNDAARITEVTDSIGRLLFYERNEDQLITRSIDGNQNETRFIYDDVGNLILTENVGISGSSNSPGVASEFSNFPLGQVGDIALEDIDNDGYIDLLGTDRWDDMVHIALGSASGQFQKSESVFVGDGPSQILLEDFNQDGNLDFVTANRDNSISIAIGLGNGQFRQASQLFLGGAFGVEDIAVGDITNDGFMDIVATAPTGTSVYFEGVGDGTFEPNDLPFPLRSFELVDIDNDGNLDFAQDILNRILVRKGDGTGQFNETFNIDAPNLNVSEIKAADINQDGVMDFVAINRDAPSVISILGLGNDQFETPIEFNSGNVATEFEIADINRDGFLDILVLESGESVTTLLGDGNGSFSKDVKYRARLGTNSLAVADINSDGFVEYATGSTNGEVAIQASNLQGLKGQEIFTKTIPHGPFASNFILSFEPYFSNEIRLGEDQTPGQLVIANHDDFDAGEIKTYIFIRSLDQGIARTVQTFEFDFEQHFSSTIGDFNNDGLEDAIVGLDGSIRVFLGSTTGELIEETSFSFGFNVGFGTLESEDFDKDGNKDVLSYDPNGNFKVFLGQGNGSFASSLNFSAGDRPADLTYSDFNNDGHLDLAFSDNSSDSVGVMFGLGTGEFQSQVNYDVDESPTKIRTNDIDGDGFEDLIVASESRLGITLLKGNADGTFGDRFFLRTGETPIDISVYDLDEDGHQDLVALHQWANDVAVAFGNGDFSFGQPTRIEVPAYLIDHPVQLAVEDHNQDGISDIGVRSVSNEKTETSYILGNGDRTFASTILTGTGTTPTDVGWIDLNNDGFDDFITSNQESDDLTVNFGSAEGTFSNANFVASLESPDAITVGDLNDDNIDDLIAVSETTGIISVFVGNGSGGFEPTIELNTSDELADVEIADFNNDGTIDIVVANKDADSVTVWAQQLDGSFIESETAAVGDSPIDIELGDLNADGHPDLIVANQRDGDVSVLIGNGDGTFSPQQTYDANVLGFLDQLVVADVDGDSRLDIVAEGSILWGRGDGTLEVGQVYDVSGQADLVVVDLNFDGLDDIISISRFDDGVKAFINNGSRSFSFDRTLAPELEYGGEHVLAKDINGDGNLEIVAINKDLSFAHSFEINQVIRSSRAASVVSMTYDPVFNQLLTRSDERGITTAFEIDDLTGNVLTASFGDSTDVEYTYTDTGQIETTKDELGRLTRYEYDNLGRLEKVTFAEGTPSQASQLYEYDEAGNQSLFTDENGHDTSYVYDEMNRLLLVSDHLGHQTIFEYDLAGNLIVTTDAELSSTTNRYDSRNRLVRSNDQLGNTTEYRYDAESNLQFTIDPNQLTTENRYDERNRLISTRDARNGLTRFEYDDNGNVISLIDPEQNRTRFFYDAKDRLTREQDPRGNATTYRYDGNDNLVEKTDRNNRITSYDYDRRDRLTEETWTGGDIDNTINYEYDLVGNLKIVDDAFSKLTYEYDSRDRMLSVLSEGINGAPVSLVEYTHDDVGNVLTVRDTVDGQQGALTSYVYDPLNRVIEINQSDLDPTNGEVVSDKSVVYTYNKIGQYTTLSRYSDLAKVNLVAQTTYGYDSINRLQNINHGTEENSREFGFFDYEFDRGSRISQIKDIHGVTSYTYDATNQLVGADRETGDVRGDESYTYDQNGNRTSSHLHGTGYITDTGNRLVSDGTYDYEYDNEGNMIRRTVVNANSDSGPVGSYREFTWDNRNRLVAVVDFAQDASVNTLFAFRYDYQNRRSFSAIDDKATYYVYEDEDVILDKTSGEADMRYLHGPQLDETLNQESTGRTGWMMFDSQGSIVGLVSSDQAVVDSKTFDSNGIVFSAEAQDTRWGYIGREFESELGLNFFRSRYYDSSQGRFISSDQRVFTGDGANPFIYSRNSALNRIDPFGMESIPTPGLPKGRPPKRSEIALFLRRVKAIARQSAQHFANGTSDHAAGVFRGLKMDEKLQTILETAYKRLPRKSARSLFNSVKKEFAKAFSSVGNKLKCGGLPGLLLPSFIADIERKIRAEQNGFTYEEQLRADTPPGTTLTPLGPFPNQVFGEGYGPDDII